MLEYTKTALFPSIFSLPSELETSLRKPITSAVDTSNFFLGDKFSKLLKSLFMTFETAAVIGILNSLVFIKFITLFLVANSFVSVSFDTLSFSLKNSKTSFEGRSTLDNSENISDI